MTNPIIEIAKEFKKAEKSGNYYDGFIIGTVVAGLPNIMVQTEPEIIIGKDRIIFASILLSGYTRNANITDGTTRNVEIEYTDSLQVGDKLILIPNGDDNLYLAIDKAVTL